MFDFSVRNEKGDILNFDNKNYSIYKISGLNPAGGSLHFSEMANFDGSIYNSGQIQNRNIVLYVKIYGDIEKNRINLYKYFGIKKLVRVFYKSDFNDVYIDGRVEKFEIDLFSRNEIAQISIICEDPYFKSTVSNMIDFSKLNSLFEFPFSISKEGIEFSRIENLSQTIISNGEVETGMIITLYAKFGSAKNPKIINRTNQTYLSLNIDLNAGDKVIINTNKGKKSIKLIQDSTEKNILNSMVIGSSWIKLSSGENEISYECEKGILDVNIQSISIYEGV